MFCVSVLTWHPAAVFLHSRKNIFSVFDAIFFWWSTFFYIVKVRSPSSLLNPISPPSSW